MIGQCKALWGTVKVLESTFYVSALHLPFYHEVEMYNYKNHVAMHWLLTVELSVGLLIKARCRIWYNYKLIRLSHSRANCLGPITVYKPSIMLVIFLMGTSAKKMLYMDIRASVDNLLNILCRQLGECREQPVSEGR